MRAVILAAGIGSRLRPLTDTTPKCLVTVGGQTLLDRWVGALEAMGIVEILVNVHHLADQVFEHLQRREGTARITVAHEPTLLGSAGTLRANRDFLTGEGAFLAVNADNLTNAPLRPVLQAHADHRPLATLATFRAPCPSQCGILEVKDGKVVGFEEKPAQPRSDLANAGIYVFSPEVIDLIEDTGPHDIGYDVIPRLVGRARAVTIPPDSYFLDIGTREALARAEQDWQGGLIP